MGHGGPSHCFQSPTLLPLLPSRPCVANTRRLSSACWTNEQRLPLPFLRRPSGWWRWDFQLLCRGWRAAQPSRSQVIGTGGGCRKKGKRGGRGLGGRGGEQGRGLGGRRAGGMPGGRGPLPEASHAATPRANRRHLIRRVISGDGICAGSLAFHRLSHGITNPSESSQKQNKNNQRNRNRT